MRIGIGYDVHQLGKDRPLILGGVTIPYPYGHVGHSDADVLTHAIMDAILGALNLGSIGDHFPDTDTAYLNISSMTLLDTVIQLVSDKQYVISNIDSVVIAQKPKLQPYITDIQTSLAKGMLLKTSQVSVKATTTERLGFEGREEGISSQAVVLLTPA